MPKATNAFTNFITGEKVTAHPWQLALKTDDYYIIETYIFGQPLTIFGHILERFGRIKNGTWHALAYSQDCPDGELGIVHICDPTRQISKEEFEQAMTQGWPATWPLKSADSEPETKQ